MADKLTCPACGEPVPRTGQSAYGVGGPVIAWQPPRSRADCPNPDCGASLVRETDPPDSPWRLADQEPGASS